MSEEKVMGHLTNSPVENPSDKAATHTHSLKQPEITEILRPSVHSLHRKTHRLNITSDELPCHVVLFRTCLFGMAQQQKENQVLFFFFKSQHAILQYET